MRVQGENVKLVKQISVHEYDLKVLALEVKTLRAKNTRLANKVGVLTTTLKETKNTDTPQVKEAELKILGRYVLDYISITNYFIAFLCSEKCCQKGSQRSTGHQESTVSYLNRVMLQLKEQEFYRCFWHFQKPRVHIPNLNVTLHWYEREMWFKGT